MPFRVNKVVDEAEHVRHNTQEQYYISQLRERGMILEVENILVDAEQLVQRTFQCNTNYCVRCSGSGSGKEYKGSCCTDLQVDITPSEKAQLVEMAKLARRKLKFTKTDPVGKVVDRVLADKFTEISEEHETLFLHKRNGACAMSWMDVTGRLRCSINTLCEKLDLTLTDYKPDPCFLFPLHYAQIGKDQYLVTVLSEETRFWIEQHPDVAKVKCLRIPEPGSPPAYVFLRHELEYIFGKRFYRKLDEMAQPLLKSYYEEQRKNGAANNSKARGRKRATAQ